VTGRRTRAERAVGLSEGERIQECGRGRGNLHFADADATSVGRATSRIPSSL
jgi:hypothetical protein